MTETEPEVVLVTGGASGIGAAVARRFADSGARVVIADIDQTAGEDLAERIGALFVRTDVTVEADNEAVVDAAVGEFGRLDVVHLNAGVGGAGGAGEHFDIERYRRAIAVNIDGTMFGIRAAWRAMRAADRGAIVVTSSLAGVTPSPFDPVYSATKHAIIGLVRSLAGGWIIGGSAVTLNAVCPGFVRTPLLPQRAQEQIAAMGYALADPAEIAAAVEFIVRDGRTGKAWLAQAGQQPQLFEFGTVDLPRA